MLNKTKFLAIHEIDRIIRLHGLLKLATSEVAYYHIAGEYDELMAEFYVLKGTPKPEALLCGSRFLYICRIEAKKIYNITKDEAEYLKRFNSLYEAVKAIKKDYSGILYTIGGRNIINLFYAIKPNKKEDFQKC